MADAKQLKMIQAGVSAWNTWRSENPETGVDLSKANLSGLDLTSANLAGANLFRSNAGKANLSNADLSGANLFEANLEKARLTDAKLIGADLGKVDVSRADLQRADLSNAIMFRSKLYKTNLTGARLFQINLSQSDLYKALFTGANLQEADLNTSTLSKADFSGADLTNANLQNAILVETKIDQVILRGAKVYGMSVWAVKGTPKDQQSLIITAHDEPVITVDDLQMAQFIYLILNRENIRNVIDTITSKAVLILGRFTTERKMILEKVGDELRSHNLLPVIFDFDRPSSRDFTETIKTLAGISLFIVADITNPKSSPLELQAVVPDYQVPLAPIIQEGEKPFSMFTNLYGKYNWVLQPLSYSSVETLLLVFKELIIDKAIAKVKELELIKATDMQTLSADDYLQKKGHMAK